MTHRSKLQEFLASIRKNIDTSLLPSSYLNIDDIEAISRLLGPDHYVTITDLIQGKKIVVSGLEYCLGYSAHEFSLEKSLSIIPEPYRMMVYEYGQAAYHLLQSPSMLKKLDHHSAYFIAYPVIDAHGKRVEVSRTSKSLAWDENGQVIGNINLCHVKRIIRTPIVTKPRFKHVSPDLFSKEENHLINTTVPIILNSMAEANFTSSILSETEWKIAQEQAQHHSSTKIAGNRGLSPHTIHQHSKNIKRKVENLFKFRFDSGSQASIYLKELGFLDCKLNSIL